MAKDPWTDPDPQPGDFDVGLAALDARDVQVVEAGPGATLKIVVSLEGEVAKQLERLALERHRAVDQVVADLIRNA